MRRALIGLSVVIALAVPATAQLTLMGAGGGYGGAAAYSGPGDKVSGASAFWGLRGYNAAFSGTVATVCDGATGLVCVSATWAAGVLSIPLVGGVACNNTSAICDVKTLNDQTGNGFDITQATVANRPTLIVAGAANGCPTTSLPCMGFARASSQVLISATAYTQAQPISLELVGNRTGTTTSIQVGVAYGTSGSIGWSSANNTLRAAAGTNLTAAGADSTWHAIQGVLNGASGSLSADGTTTNGNTGTNTAATLFFALGANAGSANPVDGKIAEAGVWPVAFSAQNISDLNSNAHSYWGF